MQKRLLNSKLNIDVKTLWIDLGLSRLVRSLDIQPKKNPLPVNSLNVPRFFYIYSSSSLYNRPTNFLIMNNFWVILKENEKCKIIWFPCHTLSVIILIIEALFSEKKLFVQKTKWTKQNNPSHLNIYGRKKIKLKTTITFEPKFK